MWCWITTNLTTTFSDTLNKITSFDFRYRSPFVRNKPAEPLQWRKLWSIPTKQEIVLFSAEPRVAVVANQPLVQCVPSALPPRDEVAGRNVDNSHLVRDQEHVEPTHFPPVRLRGVMRNAKPSHNSALSSYCILGMYHLTQQGTADNPCYRNVSQALKCNLKARYTGCIDSALCMNRTLEKP
jgi:hypothetical protein